MAQKRSFVQISYIFLFILFVIILFLGALYFLLALPRCAVYYPFTCYGHEFKSDSVDIYIKKNLPDNIFIKNIKLNNCNKQASDTLLGDEVKKFTLKDCNFKFFYKNEFIIEYQLIGESNIPHTQTGFVSGVKGINL